MSQRQPSPPHFYRVASANRAERLQFFELIGGEAAAKKKHINPNERVDIIEDLRQAVYCAFLVSFVQGMNLIARASRDEKWNIKLSECIQIWRAGCIIQSDYIADLLQPIYEKDEGLMNLLLAEKVAEELKKTMPALKRVIAAGLQWDTHMYVIPWFIDIC
jgi:6-phosphogluconate dehydrogenase